MSHLAEVQVELDSLSAVKQALEEMGYEVREGKHELKDFDWKLTCDLSIKKNGKQIMVGFKQQEDGSVKVEADWWGSGVNRDDFQQKLKQLHSKHKVIDTVRKQGWKVGNAEQLEDGRIRVKATRWV